MGSAAGWVWSIIHPLVLWASYVFIFEYCLHQALEGGLTNNYPLNLFAGMLPWFLFSDTVLRASSSIVEHANLITKTMFPSEILPVSIFLSSLASHLVVTVIAAVVACAIQKNVNPASVAAARLDVDCRAFFVGWAGLPRPCRFICGTRPRLVVVVDDVLVLADADFHSGEQVSSLGAWVLRWNPMAYVVRAYRVMLLGRTAPSLHDMAAASGFAVVTFVLGGLFFRHMKKGFADVL